MAEPTGDFGLAGGNPNCAVGDHDWRYGDCSCGEPEPEVDLSDCPYFARCMGVEGADPEGICSYGCVDEPACITCQPSGGWPGEAALTGSSPAEPECSLCVQYAKTGGPSHNPSPFCESGKRPHCTCDRCW